MRPRHHRHRPAPRHLKRIHAFSIHAGGRICPRHNELPHWRAQQQPDRTGADHSGIRRQARGQPDRHAGPPNGPQRDNGDQAQRAGEPARGRQSSRHGADIGDEGGVVGIGASPYPMNQRHNLSSSQSSSCRKTARSAAGACAHRRSRYRPNNWSSSRMPRRQRQRSFSAVCLHPSLSPSRVVAGRNDSGTRPEGRCRCGDVLPEQDISARIRRGAPSSAS